MQLSKKRILGIYLIIVLKVKLPLFNKSALEIETNKYSSHDENSAFIILFQYQFIFISSYQFSALTCIMITAKAAITFKISIYCSPHNYCF